MTKLKPEPKFKPGDEVYNMRWPTLNKSYVAEILAVVPPTGWFQQPKYIVTYTPIERAIASEEELVLIERRKI